MNKSREYYIYLPGCPYSVFTEEQRERLPKGERIRQGEFAIYAKDVGSSLGFWGFDGSGIFSKRYEYKYGALSSELQPDDYFDKARLVFWPEDGKEVIALAFNWTEETQRTFVAEDEYGSGEYDVDLYVKKDLQSVVVRIQS